MLKETIKKLLDWVSDKGNRILIWLLGQKPACASFFQRGLPISRLNKEEKEIAQAGSDGSIHCDQTLFFKSTGSVFCDARTSRPNRKETEVRSWTEFKNKGLLWLTLAY